MARRFFFRFHYERDVWRASQVRNSWLTKPDRETTGFWDAPVLEDVKKSSGLIGEYVHKINDNNQQQNIIGKDPFVELGWKNFKTYDWVNDNGYNNLGNWIEAVADRVQTRKM